MTKAIQAVVMIAAFGIAFGQPPGPNITGTVTDASGALIPGAKVALFRTTDIVPLVSHNDDRKGEFQFIFRSIQVLRLVAEANCFKPTIVEGITGKRNENTECSGPHFLDKKKALS